MTARRRLFPLLLLLAAAPALRADDAEAKKAHEKEIETAVEDFKKAYKGTDNEKCDAIRALAAHKDKKVIATLGGVFADAAEAPRIEAAKELGGCLKDADAAQALLKGLAAAKKEPAVAIACLDALGRLREWSATPALEDHFNDGEADVARAAVRAAGSVRDPAAVDALIDLHRNTGPRSRRDWLRPLVNASLNRLAGQTFTDTRSWEDWWKANGARVTAELQKEDRDERAMIARGEKPPDPAAAGGNRGPAARKGRPNKTPGLPVPPPPGSP